MAFVRSHFAGLSRLFPGLLIGLLLALPGLTLAESPTGTPTEQPTASATPLASPVPAPTHSSIPFKQDKQSSDSMAYQSFAGLVLVGLAAYGIVLGLKRFGGMPGGVLGKARRVRTLEAIRLSRRSMLYVVEYKGQELLLAENEHGIQLVSSSPLPESNASGAQDANT
jgi:flagellar biogenesis protein FliO